VSHIDHCKELDYPHGEDVCQLGCQQARPRFTAELFKVKAVFDRRGQSRTMTVTPLQ
jgi:hypothetical protein